MRGRVFVRCAVCFAVLIILLPLVFCFEARGVSIDSGSWENFVTSLPEGATDGFDSGALEDSESFGEAVSEMSSARYVIGRLLECAGLELRGALTLFCTLCALLTLSAAFGGAGSATLGASVGGALRFCSAGAIFASVIYSQYGHFERIGEFFEALGGLMRAMIPLSASIWAMGGNLISASSASATLYVMLGVGEVLFSASVTPVCCVMSVLNLCDAMSDEMRVGRMLGAIRRIYNFFLCTVMTILVSCLAAQTAISASADGAAARTARLVSGSFIPVLGGSVGETLRTVASGVSYLKNVFGVGGILMIFSLLLPVCVSVLLYRTVFIVCGAIADLFGCASEARLLDGLGEVYGTMLAVITSVSVMFVLALCIFMQSVVAVA
jgi:hypothetical protein